ncbi:hypothetical protein TNCV_1525711 [Trichonephila clavipes]|nr:hypothetical protein TNCV_1525711 [Trichonephila clavipes]
MGMTPGMEFSSSILIIRVLEVDVLTVTTEQKTLIDFCTLPIYLCKGARSIDYCKEFIHRRKILGNQGEKLLGKKIVRKSNPNDLSPYLTKEVAEASMQSAALEEVTLTNSSDIIISEDGTWKTRGYFSRVAVCAAIGDKTRKCIDAEVMPSFCKGCDS